ncbi:hypothetical protein [Pseudarthrobacter sp. BIM B-2242]|uniref:hypothetical protein n=1 Tax=Pseudarthrobacter sp. BIM B-2242 TaxID=2772401 RepID=UPI00168ABE03|nr:hypothetical protein [Pseudarthrobacter sp. BIM B-2242]QOD06051.1 hypothetical protein IDT60_21030 [Pseudarthrobacter sp. BIM B-2242]
MRGRPTAEDLRHLNEFREALLLPTPQETRLAIIKSMPPSKDPADCICAALKGCDETENPCPHCRSLDPYDECPQLGSGCGLLADDCDCCTPEQRRAAARGRA